MKAKIWTLIPTSLATFAAYIVANSQHSGMCANTFQHVWPGACTYEFALNVGSPAYAFLVIILLISLVVASYPTSIFISWLKFALFTVPLLAILAANTAATNGGFGFLAFSKAAYAQMIALFFLVLSLIFVVLKSNRKKGESNI